MRPDFPILDRYPVVEATEGLDTSEQDPLPPRRTRAATSTLRASH
jgi:hypothetical protein